MNRYLKHEGQEYKTGHAKGRALLGGRGQMEIKEVEYG
jgi:hypothetical protein